MPAKDWLGVSLSCFHISAALDLHSITPFIREQLTGQLFTVTVANSNRHVCKRNILMSSFPLDVDLDLSKNRGPPSFPIGQVTKTLLCSE